MDVPPLANENYQWLFEGRRKAVAGNQLKAAWHQQWEVGMQQMIEDELLLKGTKTPKEVVVAMKRQLGNASIQIYQEMMRAGGLSARIRRS